MVFRTTGAPDMIKCSPADKSLGRNVIETGNDSLARCSVVGRFFVLAKEATDSAKNQTATRSTGSFDVVDPSDRGYSSRDSRGHGREEEPMADLALAMAARILAKTSTRGDGGTCLARRGYFAGIRRGLDSKAIHRFR